MNPPRILLIDDEPIALKSLQRLLFADAAAACGHSR